MTTASLRPVAPDADDTTPAEPYREQLREGWRFLRRDRVLFGIAVMVALTNLLDLSWVSVLLPVWARDNGGGAAVIGLVLGVFAGASMVGALCAAAWADRLSRYRTYLVAFLITGLPRFVLFALDVPLWLVIGFCVVGGFASGFLNPVLGAVIFERIPAPLVGRVSSLITAMCFALMPLGGLLGGALVTGLGLSWAMLAVGIAYFAVTMLPAVDPRWREMDRRPEPAAEPVSA